MAHISFEGKSETFVRKDNDSDWQNVRQGKKILAEAGMNCVWRTCLKILPFFHPEILPLHLLF